jgi:hypothetical protein
LVFDNDLEDVGILLGKKAKIEAEICRASWVNYWIKYDG